MIRSAALGTLGKGWHTWSWNGRKSNGAYPPTGTYRVQIAAVAGGHTKTAAQSVRMTTELRTKNVAKSTSGYNTSAASRAASCYVDYDPYDYVSA